MEKSYVSLEQNLCPICGKIHEVGILLHQRLSKVLDRKTLTGYGYCPECQKMIDDNRIAIIEVSNTHTDKDKDLLKQENADRTGIVFWIRKKVADQIFNIKFKIPMAFIDVETAEKLKEMLPKE